MKTQNAETSFVFMVIYYKNFKNLFNFIMNENIKSDNMKDKDNTFYKII